MNVTRRQFLCTLIISKVTIMKDDNKILTDCRNLLPSIWDGMFVGVGSIMFDKEDFLPSGVLGGVQIVDGVPNILIKNIITDNEYMASVLVHEAWHAQQYLQGRKYYGTAAERECYSLQAICLSQLKPTHVNISWLWDESLNQPDNGPLKGNPL